MKGQLLNRAVIPVVLITVYTALPEGVMAQRSTAAGFSGGPDVTRGFIVQAGSGITIPLLHLSATDDLDDGYATPGTTLIFRAYLPFKERIDLMVDLILPKFKADEKRFKESTGIRMDEAQYKGKALSLGARWFVYNNPSRKGFLMASAGMYQLIFDRFLNGARSVLTNINGAYKLGGAVGGGLEFKIGDVVMDGVLRYHHYTDPGNLGEGNLAWLEIGLQVVFAGRK